MWELQTYPIICEWDLSVHLSGNKPGICKPYKRARRLLSVSSTPAMLRLM